MNVPLFTPTFSSKQADADGSGEAGVDVIVQVMVIVIAMVFDIVSVRSIIFDAVINQIY